MEIEAWPVTVPALSDRKVMEHVPFVVPVLAQLLVTSWYEAPLLFVSVTVGFVPVGALTKPAPSPLSISTVTVNVWYWPTALTASEPMVILASTQVLVAGPLLSPVELVETGMLTPRTLTVADAEYVPVPVESE